MFHTVLGSLHESSGAHMVPFAGWYMPLRFTSELAEHRAVRESAALFDLSHMGQLEVSGPTAGESLDAAVVTRPSTMAPGRARYSLILNPDGGIVDDLIIYRLAENEFLVVANGANRERVLDELTDRAHAGTQVIDHTHSRAMIAIQGPRSAEIAQSITDINLDEMRYYTIQQGSLAGIPALIARTGYTGERGYEFMVPAESAERVWNALKTAGGDALAMAGLASRDTLRLEAGMPLYGNELSESVGPRDVGFERVVAPDHEFVGREAFEASQARTALVGLSGEGRRAARAGSPILKDGTQIGTVTSGALSPTLGHPIALALIDPAFSTVGTQLVADVRGHQLPMTVVELPFYSHTR